MLRPRHVAERNLVRTPRALAALAVDVFGPGPALRRAQDDHRPARPLRDTLAARARLDVADLADHAIERRRHQAMHDRRIVTLDVMRIEAVSAQQRVQLVVRNACEHRGIGDLVAVQMQDRQHGAVARGIDELVRVPARGERAGFRLAVADDARDDEVRIVEGGAIGVRERVTELAAFVDRSGRLGGRMARDAARKGELAKELREPRLVA